ncbi:MAG TPA: LEA type 2 family protein [Gemmatimonadaceae bacterium]|jgi:LEA14-like dessication related protein
MRRFVAPSIVAAVLVGCATLGRGAFQNPIVSLRDVHVNGVGLNGGSVDVVVGVYNPNHYDLNATRMTYRVYVDTVALGNGATDVPASIGGGDSTEVHLPLKFTWAGVGALGRELIGTGTVTYRILGDMTVGSSLGTFTLPYDRTGRFSTLGGPGH